jgi:acetoacetyl-CoA reductase
MLAKAQYRVAVTYAADTPRAEEFTKLHAIPAFRWDVSDAKACEKHVPEVERALGPIDILVNNAGITRDAGFMKMSLEQWRQVIAVDLDSCFAMSKAVWPGMKARKWGRIINISSVNGQAGQFGQANYSAAKAGMLGFTKALAQEGAREGITVNAIAPGYIDTDMVKGVPAEILQKIIAHIPVGRLGRPEEIARCVAFLIAEEAGFITGSTLSVNGGMRME